MTHCHYTTVYVMPQEAKATAPRHPHRHASTQPSAAKVIHPVLNAVDEAVGQVKDAIAHNNNDKQG